VEPDEGNMMLFNELSDRARRIKLCYLALASAVALAFFFPPAIAQSSSDPKRVAFEAVDRNAEAIATVGDVLYYFGEPGMQEYESSKYLKQTLEQIGFNVELGGAGLPTNVWAKWGSGKPVIIIATEMDALPEGSQTPGSIARKPLVEGAPGHMEGHNVMAAVAVGAGHAVKKAMEQLKISGTVILSIGPAEEQVMSRPYLVREGYLKDVDAGIITHIKNTLSTGYGLQNYALIGAKFTFKGRTAHSSVNPWEGVDAVDAVELMDIGFDKLREHLRPTYRGHRAITIGGAQPNIIPAVGQIWWFIRDANGPWAKENFDKLVNIARGAALMTGTTMAMEPFGAAWPSLANKTIAEAIQKNIELGSLRFPSAIPGVQAHYWTAGIAPTTSIAHKGAVVGAKVMAASILDLLLAGVAHRGKEAVRARYQGDQIFFSAAARCQAAG
jgi:aminobenzoyl-glutamate utilization protein B